ncbi:MAG: DNA polymerase III subunit delta, partial [Bacteroidales bacterium]|nr:DNA polymerase III subunit delta [Bacteroidales bacterium]
MNTNKRIYLLLGPETGNKGIRLKEIRASLRQEFGSDPEIHRFYPFETLNGEIFTALHNNSLFSDHRLVILSQAESLQAGQINELAHYIEKPVDTATLVIISALYYLPTKLSKGIPKNQIITFWEMYENRKPDWLRSLFAKAGFAITGDAIELLLELVENNTQELRIIADQLIQFIASEKIDTVTEETVEQYIQHTRQESVFSLFEHIATGSYQRVIDVLHALIRSGDGESVPLLAGLTWQFRRLFSIEEILAQGEPWDEASKKASVMGKA